jgi:hypothetical protein
MCASARSVAELGGAVAARGRPFGLGFEEDEAPGVIDLVEAQQEARVIGCANAEVAVVLAWPLVENLGHVLHGAGEPDPAGDQPTLLIRAALHAKALHQAKPTGRPETTHDRVGP